MYGKYKSRLLIAMGCDENNELFPLTFAITKCKNMIVGDDSWHVLEIE